MRLDLLPTFDAKTKLVNVVVETPRGCRNKYAYNPDLGAMELRKVLPLGHAFPFDFGFVPQTKGSDGDPLDILVLADEALVTGCVVACRVIGVIVARQTEGRHSERNDRLIAVPRATQRFAQVHTLSQLEAGVLADIRTSLFPTMNSKEKRSGRCVTKTPRPLCA